MNTLHLWFTQPSTLQCLWSIDLSTTLGALGTAPQRNQTTAQAFAFRDGISARDRGTILTCQQIEGMERERKFQGGVMSFLPRLPFVV